MFCPRLFYFYIKLIRLAYLFQDENYDPDYVPSVVGSSQEETVDPGQTFNELLVPAAKLTHCVQSIL